MKTYLPINTLSQLNFFRRLAALLYDSVILLAVLFIATTLFLIATGPNSSNYRIIFMLYIYGIWFSFFAWFWIYRGQTLGMLAWHIRIETQSGQPLRLKHACLRFFTAIPSLLLGGIGLFWAFFNKSKLTLHDQLSGTRLVVIPTQKKSS